MRMANFSPKDFNNLLRIGKGLADASQTVALQKNQSEIPPFKLIEEKMALGKKLTVRIPLGSDETKTMQQASTIFFPMIVGGGVVVSTIILGLLYFVAHWPLPVIIFIGFILLMILAAIAVTFFLMGKGLMGVNGKIQPISDAISLYSVEIQKTLTHVSVTTTYPSNTPSGKSKTVTKKILTPMIQSVSLFGTGNNYEISLNAKPNGCSLIDERANEPVKSYCQKEAKKPKEIWERLGNKIADFLDTKLERD